MFIASLVLVSCGYFIWLSKSVFNPVRQILFLGFISDSVKQAFLLPDVKKQKFASLRDSIITLKVIPIKTLQRFVGKAVSFSLAVPAARLFARQINAHIGKGIKHSKPVKMTNQLRQELEHWKFIDNWNGFLPWKQEKHFTVKIISDASDSGWGGSSLLLAPASSQEIIGTKKTLTSLVLQSGRQRHSSKRYPPFRMK